jgi:hypothetical protein
MNISLKNYHPFDGTKWVLDYTKEQWNSQNLDRSKKVTILALTILSVPFALAIDLAFSATILGISAITQIYQACCQPSEPSETDEESDNDEDPSIQVLSSPYKILPSRMTNIQFFEDALKQGFSFLDPSTKDIYRELVLNDGMLHQGDPPISIHHWMSGCLLVHYLRTRSHDVRAIQLYPGSSRNPDITANVQRTLNAFNSLEESQKAAALLRIVIPQSDPPLTNDAREVVRQIQERAIQISQDRYYLTTILYPLNKNFLNSHP